MKPSPRKSAQNGNGGDGSDATSVDGALIVYAAPATAPMTSSRSRRRPWKAATVALLACAALVVVFLVLTSIVGLSPPLPRTRPQSTRLETELKTEILAKTSGGLNTESSCACPTNTTDATVVASSPSSPSSLASSLGLDGGRNVSECCCTFSDLEVTNSETVRPLLEKIVRTPFFSHFDIDLCSDCRLWDDSPMCVLRDCAVCECDDPPDWARGVQQASTAEIDSSHEPYDCEHVEDGIVTRLDPRVSDGWPGSYSFSEEQQRMVTAVDSATDEDTAVVVDLRLNPERYTGYGGKSAARVWSAIHTTNCFRPPQVEGGGTTDGTNRDDGKDREEGDDPAAYCHLLLPDEQRLYNRVISGMHSSISLHIANSYCEELDRDNPGECLRWGRNVQLAHDRVLDHEDRVENLYVAFAVLLRAVVRAGQAVTAAVPHGDTLYADGLAEWTDELLPALGDMARRCPRAFDESRLLLLGDDVVDGPPGDVEERRSELIRRFDHLREIMRCVGCDRCKLWGTLQTLGVSTALRVLLGDGDGGGSGGGYAAPTLSRREAVALVNTLERFSSALVYAQEFGRNNVTR